MFNFKKKMFKKIWKSLWGKVAIIGGASFIVWHFVLKDKYKEWKNEKKSTK